MAKQLIKISNMKELQILFRDMQIGSRKTLKDVRRVVKEPFKPMLANSRTNLTGQGSVKTGNLKRALTVKSSFKRRTGYFSVAFGAKSSGKKKTASNKGYHFHIVNSGTKKRFHKNFQHVGAVGKRKTARQNMNPSFKIGFADKAIRAHLNSVESKVVSGLSLVYGRVMRRNRT